MYPREIRAILVTRHTLLKAQEEAIEKAGLKVIDIVPQVPSDVAELQKWCKELKARGIEAIVTTALPLHLIPPILSSGLRLFVLKMQAVKTTESREEAERLVAEKQTHRIILPSRFGEKETYRVVEFTGLYEVKKVEIVEELVVPA